ncbi:hypothetical protein H4219_001927, partial [Mycoemilia scoparia]
ASKTAESNINSAADSDKHGVRSDEYPQYIQLLYMDNGLLLSLVLVHNFRNTRRFEILYYVPPFIVSLIPMIISLSLHKRKNVSVTLGCYSYAGEMKDFSYVNMWLQYSIWIWLGILLTCASFITILISIKVRQAKTSCMLDGLAISCSDKVNGFSENPPYTIMHTAKPAALESGALKETRKGSSMIFPRFSLWQVGEKPKASTSSDLAGMLQQGRQQPNVIKRLVLRLVWIPALPLICESIKTAFITINNFTKDNIDELLLISTLIYALQILFAIIPFFNDVSVVCAMKEVRKELIRDWYINPLISQARVDNLPIPESLRSSIMSFKHKPSVPISQAVFVPRPAYHRARDSISDLSDIMDYQFPTNSSGRDVMYSLPESIELDTSLIYSVHRSSSLPNLPANRGSHQTYTPETRSTLDRRVHETHPRNMGPYTSSSVSSRTIRMCPTVTGLYATDRNDMGTALAEAVDTPLSELEKRARSRMPMRQRFKFWFCKHILQANLS